MTYLLTSRSMPQIGSATKARRTSMSTKILGEPSCSLSLCGKSRVAIARPTRSSLRAVALLIIDDPEPGEGIEEHHQIGEDEDPVLQQPAINREARRGADLADEEPLGDAFAGVLLPLFIDL